MAELSLKAKSREVTTKGARNKMRKSGVVPGVFYSTESEPVSISATELGLKPFVYTSEGHIVDLTIDDKEPQKAILKDVQFHPITDRIIHFDLLGLTAGHKITVQVPVVLTGSAIGVKEGGVLVQQLHKVDLECLPKDIPDHIELDIEDLSIGMAKHIKDLEFAKGKFIANDDVMVVSVEKTKGASEDEAAAAEEESAEPEVINKGKSEEEGE